MDAHGDCLVVRSFSQWLERAQPLTLLWFLFSPKRRVRWHRNRRWLAALVYVVLDFRTILFSLRSNEFTFIPIPSNPCRFLRAALRLARSYVRTSYRWVGTALRQGSRPPLARRPAPTTRDLHW